MKLWVPVVAPKFLDLLGRFSPLGKGGIGGLTLFPFIFAREPMKEKEEAHEAIHVTQQLELGVLGGLVSIPLALVCGLPWWVMLTLGLAGFAPGVGWFYWVYYSTWLYHRIRLRDGKQAYRTIPLEVEAYAHEAEGLYYLGERRWFAWLRSARSPA